MQRILIVERPDLGTLVVTGPERQSWLGRVVTCDVAGLGPGRGAYGLVLARNGHILTDVTVVVAGEAVYVTGRERDPRPGGRHGCLRERPGAVRRQVVTVPRVDNDARAVPCPAPSRSPLSHPFTSNPARRFPGWYS